MPQTRSIVGVTHIDYDVVMSKRAATPVRFDPPVADRLASFRAANPGMSLSSAANRLVDEALRMAEHPGLSSGPVLPGPAPPWPRPGRLGGHPRHQVGSCGEPGLNRDDLVSLVSDNTGIALRLVDTGCPLLGCLPRRGRRGDRRRRCGRGSHRAGLAARASTSGRLAHESAACC